MVSLRTSRTGQPNTTQPAPDSLECGGLPPLPGVLGPIDLMQTDPGSKDGASLQADTVHP